MSLKTTHNITREAALQVIISKLYSLDDDRYIQDARYLL